jgi:hypothetical protein
MEKSGSSSSRRELDGLLTSCPLSGLEVREREDAHELTARLAGDWVGNWEDEFYAWANKCPVVEPLHGRRLTLDISFLAEAIQKSHGPISTYERAFRP